jgi:DNA-binding LacI/PurR family transcriptional regulator
MPSSPLPSWSTSDDGGERSARPQMADIARLAGVSVSTVSLALRGSPSIGEQTRQRIAELARSLNYRVNVRARNLRTGTNRTIAVVVPYSRADRHHLADPFYLGLIGSIADALVNDGYQMLLARAEEHDEDLAALYETGQAAGIVLTGASRPHEACNQLTMAGVPLVVWGAPLPRQLYCTVGSDNRDGARAATLHLLDQGARQVAFVGDNELPEGAERYAGYQSALQERGLKVEPGLHCMQVPKGSKDLTWLSALLDHAEKPDAIFASCDLIAMQVVQSLQQLGKRVPADVAVCGFDDIQMAAAFEPALTTVRQRTADIGTAVVAALKAQIAGRAAQSIQLPTELVVRASSKRKKSRSR